MRNRDGFTLLELVAALSLSAVIGIWAAGFFGSQMHEYKKQTQILKTEELEDREITVLYKGEKVYSRTIRLSSVYGYLEDGEDEKGENENKDGSLSW